jgi:hypothetical protein
LAPTQLPVLTLELSYRRVRVTLWTLTLTVLALGIFREIWLALYGRQTVLGSMPPFDLNSENALGEWWSVLQLLVAAVLLSVHSVAEPNRRWMPYWFALGAIFLFLSIDESAALHERTKSLMAHYQLTGFFAFPWIIPYGLACIVLALAFFPFVRALPSRFRWRVIFAGALFLAAVLGIESLGAHCATAGGTEPRSFDRACWPVDVIAEESGEIIAITLFILALLELLRERVRSIAFNL